MESPHRPKVLSSDVMLHFAQLLTWRESAAPHRNRSAPHSDGLLVFQLYSKYCRSIMSSVSARCQTTASSAARKYSEDS